MNLDIRFRHLESTPSIKAKIVEKAQHLKKYFHGHINVKWVCSIDGKEHRSEINIHAGHNYFHAHAVNSCLYNTLDTVLAKIEKQIKRKNNQIKNGIHNNKNIQINKFKDWAS